MGFDADLMKLEEVVREGLDEMGRELMREAFRVYQREQKELADMYAYGERKGKKLGIRSEQDVVRIIREEREKRTRETAKAAASGNK